MDYILKLIENLTIMCDRQEEEIEYLNLELNNLNIIIERQEKEIQWLENEIARLECNYSDFSERM